MEYKHLKNCNQGKCDSDENLVDLKTELENKIEQLKSFLASHIREIDETKKTVEEQLSEAQAKSGNLADIISIAEASLVELKDDLEKVEKLPEKEKYCYAVISSEHCNTRDLSENIRKKVIARKKLVDQSADIENLKENLLQAESEQKYLESLTELTATNKAIVNIDMEMASMLSEEEDGDKEAVLGDTKKGEEYDHGI